MCIYTMYIYSESVFCAKFGRHPWVIVGGLLGDPLVRHANA